MRSILCAVLFLGCGNDAAKAIDGAVDTVHVDAHVDAPVDALVDAPPPPAGARRYVIDHEMLPTNNSQALMYGLDLDNDATVDNELGMVDAAFAGMGLTTQPALDHVIDTGAVIMLADLEAADLTTAATATFTMYDGANPMPAACSGTADTTCRHHLTGTATFDVASTSAHDTALPGAIAANVFTGGPGQLHFPVSLLGATVSLPLIGARVKLTGITATGLTGVVAGGISQTVIDSTLIPALRLAVTAQIANDCNALTSPPACGCTGGSIGETYLSLLDANQDCTVTVDEIKTNSLVMALLAPDVMIDGQMAVSMGVGVTAVHAAFTP
ncbi:MAG: hypothetical protein ABI591_21745 [Kofleriaceae bacterium]